MTPSRVLLSWLVLLVIAFTNGAIRQLGYARWLSDRAAHQLSTLTGTVAIGIAVWLLTRAWPLASAGQAWRVGAVWLVLTFLFETGMGLAARRPWPEIFADYALWDGRLWPLFLAFVLVAPRLALALHGTTARAP